MTAEPLAPGAPAIILYRQEDHDDNGDTSHISNYRRIKILTEEGRKYADVEVPFNKLNESVDTIHARTIKPDGTIVNFDGHVFEQVDTKSRYEKAYIKKLTLPDVQVGSIIEYYYAIDLQRHWIFYESHWIISQDLFTRHAKLSYKPYYDTENYFHPRWNWNYQGLPQTTPEPKDAVDRVVRLELFNIPAFQQEDFMPPENELRARVNFIYSLDPFETDADKYWALVGKRLNAEIDHFVGGRGALEHAVAQTVAPGDNAEVKVHKLYGRVQQIRNTSYEIRKTEQEQKRLKEKYPSSAADVWKRGYGSKDQLSALYLGLLRAAGLEAYALVVSDRNNYFFDRNSMDSTRLDATVVLVRLNGAEVFCDPGEPFAPFGMLPWQVTGVSGLKLDKNGSLWVTTPLPESTASRVDRTAALKLVSTGDLEGKVTMKYKGLEAVVRRIEEMHDDSAGRKKFLEDELKAFTPAASEVELTNEPDWSNPDNDLIGEFTVKLPGWASAVGHRVMLPVGLFTGSEKHVFENAVRVHPIYFEYPFEKRDVLSIEVPDGWKIANLPSEQNETKKPVAYSLKVAEQNGTINITRTLRVDLLLLDRKYYPTLRNFFQTVRLGDEEQIVLQPSATTASN